jgi:adenylylsulfate kinase-like enzyme
MRIDKKKGILFWITGLSGSGKSTIANLIKVRIEKKYGPTIIMSGDDLRHIINFLKYEKKDRLEFAKTKLKFYKYITDQGINLIFSTISLFDSVRKDNKKIISNYVEIFIKSKVDTIVSNNKKKLYRKKKEKIWGVNITPEFPKNSLITIENNFDKPCEILADDLVKKIFKKLIF